MSSTTLPPRPRLHGLSPSAAGLACCAVSALGYTAANICLNKLAELNCNPCWAVCNKEMVSVVIVGPWLLLQMLRGLPALPPPRSLGLLMLVGLATQLVGNTGQQWALGIAGLVVTIPTLIAAVLVATSILGWTLLGERVSWRSVVAIGMLVVAVTLLCLGAETAVRAVGAEVEIQTSTLEMAAAVGAAVMAGTVFAILSIAIRHCVTGATPPIAVVVIITGMGVVSLGPLSLYLFGWQELVHTPVEQLQWMAAAGIFNLIAFFAVSKALQLTTAIHVNLVNASQVALTTVAGIALFGEKANLWLILGVALTLAGIFLIGRPQEPQLLDRHV